MKKIFITPALRSITLDQADIITSSENPQTRRFRLMEIYAAEEDEIL